LAAADIVSLHDQNNEDEPMTNTAPLDQHGTLPSESGSEYTTDTQNDNNSSGEEIPSSRKKYLERLEYGVRNALIGMLDSLTEESFHLGLWDSDGKYASGRHRLVRRGEMRLRLTFLTMAVWYVVSYCEHALNGTFCRVLVDNLDTLDRLYEFDTPTRKRRQVSDSSELRDSLLHWYHYGCLRRILEWSMSKAILLENQAPVIPLIASREAEWRKRTEMIVSSPEKGQLDTTQRYSPQEEEVHRLILMSKELGFEPSSSKTSTVVKQVRAKIAARKRTTHFNQGPHDQADKQMTPGAPETAPWELFCLNHHTALSLQLFSSTGTDERDLTGINRDKAKLFFVSSIRQQLHAHMGQK
jgi:hypothetical protein